MDERPIMLAEQRQCPFAMTGPRETPRTAFYCRVPGGRAHIPTRLEDALYCRSGQFYACPVVRRYVRDS